ncbi:MAG: quinone-dependent dihydroorotate dehydrogenase [Patescibacteria group bacterium]
MVSLIILSLIGLADSLYLTYEHFFQKLDFCPLHNWLIDCGAVLKSPYAYLGPIPIALFGVLHYSLLLLFSILYLKTKHIKYLSLILLQTISGLFFTFYLLYVQAFILKVFCFYCLISAATSVLLLISFFIFFRSKVHSILIFLEGVSYRTVVKPIFFLLNPELVHDVVTSFGEIAGRIGFLKKMVAAIHRTNLKPTIVADISFPGKVGLSAGFDYDAKLIEFLPSLGFGFHTIGSITADSYEGNPRPRLGRLPKSKSLLVNKGLKNMGVDAIIKKIKRIRKRSKEIPLGISVAKTNCKETAPERKGRVDYVYSFKQLEKANICEYYELNISCPNAYGGEPFTTPEKLEKLLLSLSKLKISKPVFVKMPVDYSTEQTKGLCDVIVKYNLPGVIMGNLTKDRSNPKLDKEEVRNATPGNFSGKPTEDRCNNLISFIHDTYGSKLVIIGCGGIFSASDAKEKIRRGATLVQLITGLIYQGPQLVAEINAEL